MMTGGKRKNAKLAMLLADKDFESLQGLVEAATRAASLHQQYKRMLEVMVASSPETGEVAGQVVICWLAYTKARTALFKAIRKVGDL